MLNPLLNLSVLMILGLSSVFTSIPKGQSLEQDTAVQLSQTRLQADSLSHQNDLAMQTNPFNLDQSQFSIPIIISCIGDSLTAGYPYEGTTDTYPRQLQILLDTQYGEGVFEVINRGVSGYRADQILDDIQSEGWLLQDQADVILLLAGGNDLAQEYPIKGIKAVDDTVAEMQAIVDLIKAHSNNDGSTPEVILSAVPPNLIEDFWGSLLVDYYNAKLEEQIENIDIWFTSNWDDFYDTETGKAKVEWMSDLVHLNEAGYQVMAQNWFEKIKIGYFFKQYLPLVLQ